MLVHFIAGFGCLGDKNMFRVDFNISKLPTNVISRGKVKNALNSAAQKVAEVVIEEARMDYISKRKSTDPESMVIDSMKYNLDGEGDLSVSLVVFCDGATAPHAKYVEFPRQGFPGYFFMKAGGEAGSRVAGPILHGEMLLALSK